MTCYRRPGRPFRRAREWHVYDEGGRRYTDFCQADGRAVLGHRPDKLSTTVKNVISRGLWVQTQSPWPRRIHRLLETLLNPLPVIRTFFLPEGANRLSEDLEPEVRVRWWRPFLEKDPDNDHGDPKAVDLVLPLVPWPLPGIPQPICACSEMGAAVVESWEGGGDCLEVLSPFHGAGIAGVLSLLGRIGYEDRLSTASELFIPPGYTRNGIYLVRSGMEKQLFEAPEYMNPDSSWQALRELAFDRGIILPLYSTAPIIVPGRLERSEIRSWEGLWYES